MNIVILHVGFAKYLVYALKRIRETNKNANVFLISDREYKEYSKYSTYVNINKVLLKKNLSISKIIIYILEKVILIMKCFVCKDGLL
ncbi:hypothetical protein [Brachyspira sp.]|uniref:hypothetical protein n=1 Tax=Brachyspira sp. TaxID=1977261 RepID=UPI0026308A5A|nr:hypothetical protein [Brachyspira sp.]